MNEQSVNGTGGRTCGLQFLFVTSPSITIYKGRNSHSSEGNEAQQGKVDYMASQYLLGTSHFWQLR